MSSWTPDREGHHRHPYRRCNRTGADSQWAFRACKRTGAELEVTEEASIRGLRSGLQTVAKSTYDFVCSGTNR